MQDIYNVLIRPVVTEKSMGAQGAAQGGAKYTFVISPDANKIDVRNAVEVMYSTEVESVNMIPVRKKIRLIGRSKIYTKRKAAKKAIVTLKKGKTIDVMKPHEGVAPKKKAKPVTKKKVETVEKKTVKKVEKKAESKK